MDRRGFLLLAGMFVAAGVGRAHEGHLIIPEDEAVGRGRELIALLIQRGKLAASWSKASVAGVEMRTVGELEQWQLRFYNAAEDQPERRTLHVFLNYDGQFLGANFTGHGG